MKKFEEPKIEILEFQLEDVITTSSEPSEPSIGDDDLPYG